jgi:hypothetical protein
VKSRDLILVGGNENLPRVAAAPAVVAARKKTEEHHIFIVLNIIYMNTKCHNSVTPMKQISEAEITQATE